MVELRPGSEPQGARCRAPVGSGLPPWIAELRPGRKLRTWRSFRQWSWNSGSGTDETETSGP
eukprot:6726416-Alexandrium_andersonii.AAC.1